MKSLRVELGERSYPILIESGSLTRAGVPGLSEPNSVLGAALPERSLPGEVALVANARAQSLYGASLAAALEARGQRVVRIEVDEGESAKSWASAGDALDALADANFSRAGAVWALGGGVTGDLAGFVAATWMRGVTWVQVPTTLLAMVDSSVGGKTGVNHARAKNLLGAFWQPTAVWIDPATLATLAPREVSAGLAEVIKYGVIADAAFFAWLEAHIESLRSLEATALEHAIETSCAIKAAIVGRDERESDASGQRATLNYGHTWGHGLEKVASYGTLLHGEAIAVGMRLAVELAALVTALEPEGARELSRRQDALLAAAGLPARLPPIEWPALWSAMKLDKKNRGAGVNFVLPVALGRVALFRDVPESSARQAFEALRERDAQSGGALSSTVALPSVDGAADQGPERTSGSGRELEPTPPV